MPDSESGAGLKEREICYTIWYRPALAYSDTHTGRLAATLRETEPAMGACRGLSLRCCGPVAGLAAGMPDSERGAGLEGCGDGGQHAALWLGVTDGSGPMHCEGFESRLGGAAPAVKPVAGLTAYWPLCTAPALMAAATVLRMFV